jgi:hypothetical protein
MKFKDTLKDFKPLHWVYNLLHAKQLQHNKEAYRHYNIHKPLYGSISSRDFPDKTSSAWLDVNDSSAVAGTKTGFADFLFDVQQQIKQWSSNGYLVVQKHFTDEQVDEVNKAIDELIHQKRLSVTHDNKVMLGYKHSAAVKAMMHDSGLKKLVSFLLDKKTVPFQTLNFVKGSGQRAHSDSIHMTTYQLGYLVVP